MGFVGGYPVGIRMAAGLFESGDLTREEAQRLMLFCVNPSPAFVISAVGYTLLGSVKAGVVIFVSILLSSVFVGIFLGLFAGEKQKKRTAAVLPPQNRLSQSFSGAVGNGAKSMALICVWVVVFCCAGSLLSLIPMGGSAVAGLKCMLEAASGVFAAVGFVPPPVLAAALGWGGLCVYMQVLPDTQKAGLRKTLFLAVRVLSSGMSCVICKVLFQRFPFPETVPAIAQQGHKALTGSLSVSLPAAAALFSMAALFILEPKITRRSS
jgi:hypothetical protein